MQRTFSFQCASPHFATVPISFIFQTMTISRLPTGTWGLAPALDFKIPRGRQNKW